MGRKGERAVGLKDTKGSKDIFDMWLFNCTWTGELGRRNWADLEARRRLMD